MTPNYAKPLRLLRSDSEVVRAHAAFAGANIIESLQAKVAKYREQDVTADFNYRLEHEELQAKVEELTKAITDFRSGNYSDPRSYRPNDCPHGTHYWQECNNCDEEYWQSVLKQGGTGIQDMMAEVDALKQEEE